MALDIWEMFIAKSIGCSLISRHVIKFISSLSQKKVSESEKETDFCKITDFVLVWQLHKHKAKYLMSLCFFITTYSLCWDLRHVPLRTAMFNSIFFINSKSWDTGETLRSFKPSLGLSCHWSCVPDIVLWCSLSFRWAPQVLNFLHQKFFKKNILIKYSHVAFSLI